MTRDRAAGSSGQGQDEPVITIRGARQHNLRSVDLEIPWGRIVTVTGVSGSGKSSLAFDTLYAEGQRRYVETFSAYARQFLDRMDRPDVDRVEGIPPAIAIEQRTRIISSRSTVATLTEMLDHVKILYERLAGLTCDECGGRVQRDSAADAALTAHEKSRRSPVLVTFPIRLARGFGPDEVASALASQGIRRLLVGGRVVEATAGAVQDASDEIEAVLDRIVQGEQDRDRIADSVGEAIRLSRGRVSIVPLTRSGTRASARGRRGFSTSLSCPRCSIDYPDPQAGLFSFNSPVGACPRCRGFGTIIEIDPSLVIPDTSKSLNEGAVKPWTGRVYGRWRTRMRKFCERESIRIDVPWKDLSPAEARVVWDGGKGFPGISGFFSRLERKSYKMHVRVLLSRYRTHIRCPECAGGRLRAEALRWRIDGLTVPQLLALPLTAVHDRLTSLSERTHGDPAAGLIVEEMEARVRTALEVGLGYLTLDRDSRTLSGGEVERLGLATALGGSLTRTLYVLDEPSTGLHPRDVDRLLVVLRRLRDRGNTLVVVEHDLRMIAASDVVVDMGPGSGERGGRVIATGAPVSLMARRDSRTGAYLSGRRTIPIPPKRRSRDGRSVLRVKGARARNLKNIDVAIPLGMHVAMTGVSGSGKSTLLEETIHRGLLRLMGETGPEPGPFEEMTGWEQLRSVTLVDQAAVAGTPRSNPATYTGIFTGIRKLFAQSEISQQRGYAPGTFSFNVEGGRCERCQGSGHEKIEMQFLSDLYLTCPECSGTRYREEVLEARVEGMSIADVLGITIDEAAEFLTRMGEPSASLDPVRACGLGYLKLGQPLSTLSGGEAQRLKLASRLAAMKERGGLVLLDEPTRGLHPHDIRLLVDVIQRLVEGGDTVVTVEHDMDVVKCADWVIDLGPEGGDRGGRVVAAGPPEHVASASGSRTAPFLAQALEGTWAELTGSVAEQSGSLDGPARPTEIEISGARENNLDSIDVSIPLGALTVVTGVSGSGKSSLVFDVLHAEGQRRYLDSLSAYARQYLRQMARPDVERVSAVPPTVAIEQRTAQGGPRSTVATMSEILPYLRLLFARAGDQNCPDCAMPAQGATVDSIVRSARRLMGGRRVHVLAPLVRARKGFHREVARWAASKGYTSLRVDGRLVPVEPFPKLDRYKEHTIEIVVGRVAVARRGRDRLGGLVREALKIGRGTTALAPERGGEDRFFSTLGVCPSCGRGFPELDPRMFSFNSPLGACQACNGSGMDHNGQGPGTCRRCSGTRLRPASMAVTVGGRTLPDILALPVSAAGPTLGSLELDARAAEIAAPIVTEIASRIAFLERVGLSYLGLDRRATTLSSGENQRIRLAAQLGSNLRGVCYILDEPTIGLHARDGERLLRVLADLRDRGNTVVVVEHDEATIHAADHVIDLGPGAGAAGGRVVASGTPATIARCPASATGRSLERPPAHPSRGSRRPPAREHLVVRGGRANNLASIDVRFPLGRLCVVTGVSGSGKTSLVSQVLVRGLTSDGIGKTCDRIEGVEAVRRVLLVDQSPIGRTSRSTPATYVGFMTGLRRLFASLPEARARGYKPGRFSFNAGDGRCPACKGRGRIKVEMGFLPTMHVPCEECAGRRYEPETLSVAFRGHSIADVLEMSVTEALELLSPVPSLARPLGILQEMGLGYLGLGQPSPTLSGGEAQRLKLASELTRPGGAETLVVLEEPTTGLSTVDVEVLTSVLHRLVDEGSSVVVVEHNLDVIAEADWIIDLGPEGGDRGGRLVAEGTATKVSRARGSHTARFLRQRL
ncbi:MAG: excinuclease ABC subunit UvrA [Deltaproteobacteria bacterium]|nr:excinuclease ABC subunit UvrA [Deltaproteobacteria bacterium]